MMLQVPLDNVDLSSMSLLYTQGEMAAVTPVYDYDFSVLYGATSESSWREILYWVGPPGIVIGLLVLLTLDEPRALPGKGFLVPPLESSRFLKAAGCAITAQHQPRTQCHWLCSTPWRVN